MRKIANLFAVSFISATSFDLSVRDQTIDLLVTDQNPRRLLHYRSTDSGQTWGKPQTLPVAEKLIHAPHSGDHPQITASGEILTVLWTAPGTSRWGSGPLMALRSLDGGKAWKSTSSPADDGGTDWHGYSDMTVDRAGRAHAIWLDARDGHSGLRHSTLDIKKENWAKNQSIDPITCQCCWTQLSTLPDGRVAALYRDQQGEVRDMVLRVSADDGRSWSAPTTVGSFGWEVEGCPHVGASLTASPAHLHALVWTGAEKQGGLHLLRSQDATGNTWSSSRRLGDSWTKYGDIASSGNKIALVWFEHGQVKYQISQDEGKTWNDPQTFKGMTQESGLQPPPRLVVTQKNFYLAWLQKDESPAQKQGTVFRWAPLEIRTD